MDGIERADVPALESQHSRTSPDIRRQRTFHDASAHGHHACENIRCPATGISQRRMQPVADSVMNNDLPSGPPKATFVP